MGSYQHNAWIHFAVVTYQWLWVINSPFYQGKFKPLPRNRLQPWSEISVATHFVCFELDCYELDYALWNLKCNELEWFHGYPPQYSTSAYFFEPPGAQEVWGVASVRPYDNSILKWGSLIIGISSPKLEIEFIGSPHVPVCFESYHVIVAFEFPSEIRNSPVKFELGPTHLIPGTHMFIPFPVCSSYCRELLASLLNFIKVTARSW